MRDQATRLLDDDAGEYAGLRKCIEVVQGRESLFINWLTDFCALTLDMEAMDHELPVVVMPHPPPPSPSHPRSPHPFLIPSHPHSPFPSHP